MKSDDDDDKNADSDTGKREENKNNHSGASGWFKNVHVTMQMVLSRSATAYLALEMMMMLNCGF